MPRVHRRFIVVVDNRGLAPSQRQQSLEVARHEVAELGVRIGDLRIARDHLEFDVFASASVLPEALKRLEIRFGQAKYLRNLDAPLVATEKAEALLEAMRFFNCQRFWETHEVLEGVWKKAHGEERRLLQAFILLAAAFVHVQKGRDMVGFGILARANKILEETRMKIVEVDLTTLREVIKQSLEKTSLTPFQIPFEGSVGRLENLLTVC